MSITTFCHFTILMYKSVPLGKTLGFVLDGSADVWKEMDEREEHPARFVSIDQGVQQLLGLFEEGKISECKTVIEEIERFIVEKPKDGNFTEVMVVRSCLSLLGNLTSETNTLVCPLLRMLIALSCLCTGEAGANVFLEFPQIIENLMETAATQNSPLGARDPVDFSCYALTLLSNAIHDSLTLGFKFLEMNGLEILETLIRKGNNQQVLTAINTTVSLIHSTGKPDFFSDQMYFTAIVDRFGKKADDWPTEYIRFLTLCCRSGILIFTLIDYRSILRPCTQAGDKDNTERIIALLELVVAFFEANPADGTGYDTSAASIDEVDFQSFLQFFLDTEFPTEEALLRKASKAFLSFINDLVDLHPATAIHFANEQFLELINLWINGPLASVRFSRVVVSTFCKIATNAASDEFILHLRRLPLLYTLGCRAVDSDDDQACEQLLAAFDALLDRCEKSSFARCFIEWAEVQGIWEKIEELGQSPDLELHTTAHATEIIERKNTVLIEWNAKYLKPVEEMAPDDEYEPYSDDENFGEAQKQRLSWRFDTSWE